MGFDENQPQPNKATRLMDYLQKAFGYSLTATTSEKAVFLLHGPGGDNGKSTLLYLFFLLLGEYASQLQIDSLMTKQESNNSQADLADLHGARFVITSETEKGQRLAEGKLKRVTQGMGMIRAARKYENPFSFPETHKLWIDANHRPVVRGSDNAIWNRLHLVPFDVTIPKADQVPRYHESLIEAEGEAILAWAVEGAKRWWHTKGLGKPDEITNAVSGWRKESNPLREFAKDHLVFEADVKPDELPEGGYKTPIADLWKAYMAYCEENHQKALIRDDFNEQIEALGGVRTRVGKQRTRVWKGVSL